jgi:hypothetical protein
MAMKKIIVVPCIVNMRLNTCGDTTVVVRKHELEPADERLAPRRSR